ncbi:MAG: PKD domain-containing protein, partial [Candidatus Lutacidiplasmatales archaeon]
MVSLGWTAAAGLGGSNYAVTQSTSGACGPWITVGNVSTQSPTAFGMTSLAPNASYWWQVTPNGLFSSASNVAEGNQTVVAALSYTQPSSTSAQFNWTNAAIYGGLLSFVAYDLYERVNGSSPMLVASVASVGTLSYTVTGLSAGAGYSFYLSTIDCLGCGGAAPVQSGSGSNTVTFGTALPLLGSLSAARAAVDLGQPDLFTCNPSGGSSPYTFAWDYGNGTQVAGSGSVSHAFPVAGTATVTCYVKDAAATIASTSASVLVNLPPDARATANLTRADVGQSVGFDCVTANGTLPYLPLYTWTFGDGTGEQAAVPTTSHTFLTSGSLNATCLATDAASTTASARVTLTISRALDVRLVAESVRVAPEFPLNFTAVATNGSQSYTSYVWSFAPGSGSATGASVRYAFPQPGPAETAAVAVTDSNGAIVRSTISLNVTPITVVVTSPPTSGTTGRTLTFSASASGGAGGPYTYSWSFGDGSTGTGGSVAHSYSSA